MLGIIVNDLSHPKHDILAPQQAAEWNMARDQALAGWANEANEVVLRFYSWPGPTLSLGYFQRSADSAGEHLFSLPKVRRATGGGAIVHHHELTYSICFPTNSTKGHFEVLYDIVHNAVIQALARNSLQAAMVRDVQVDRMNLDAKEVEASCSCDPNAFLCFDRRAGNDVVIRGKKILGSAQRRHSRTVLQHGSILLGASQWTPHLLGIRDLLPSNSIAVVSDSIIDAIGEAISRTFDVAWESVNPDIELETSKIIESVFANPKWLEKR